MRETLYKGWKFSLKYSEYSLFVLLVMFKMFLLADYTNTIFYGEGIGGFFKYFFDFLFKGETFNYLRHDLVMISLGFLLTLSFWTFFLNHKKRIYSLVILNAIISFVLFADVIHYRYFGGFTSVSELIQINQVGNVAGSIVSLIEWKDLLFAIDLLILVPLIIFFRKRVEFKPNSRMIFSAFFVLFLGWFSIIQPLSVFYQYGGKGIIDKMMSSETVYKYVGILGYHYFDAKRFTKDYMLNLKGVSDEREVEIREWFEEKGNEKNTESFGVAKGSNLIVVQVEALQDFVMNREVNGEEITPFMNDLIKGSMYFNSFYHQAGQGRTSDADLLVNASLHPLDTGSVFARFAGNKYTTIASLVEEEGYKTSVHHAFKGSFWNRNNVYANWGYDKFYTQFDYSEGEKIGWGLGDREFLSQSIDDFPESNPFYSFMITLTSHHPYPMPEKYHTLNLDGIDNDLLENYIHSIHYVDKAVEEFVEKLKKEGLWENSIVVFYGDHDAKVLEKGENSGSFATNNSEAPLDFLLEENKIPLLIHLPNDKLKGTYDQFGGQMDLGPTLLHLLGIATKDKYLMGTDLLLDKKHNVVFSDGSFTNGSIWFDPSANGIFESGTCYDIKRKKQVDVNLCKKSHQKAVEELEISEDIILGNAFKKLYK
jgi:lipoteichoic acid synthase